MRNRFFLSSRPDWLQLAGMIAVILVCSLVVIAMLSHRLDLAQLVLWLVRMGRHLVVL